MRKLWWTYLLLALLALQSAVAAADIHLLHDAAAATAQAEAKEPPGGEELSCQQCCHCHSIKLHYLPSAQALLLGASAVVASGEATLASARGQVRLLYRPPKA